jgi:hypothetical protein
MTDASLQSVDQAVNRLSLTDPIVKLLHEVKLGRMKPTDAGLCAITESWKRLTTSIRLPSAAWIPRHVWTSLSMPAS